MRNLALCLAPTLVLAFAPIGAGAWAQSGGDAMEKLRVCLLLASAERLDCLEKLSQDLSAAPPVPAPSPSGPAPAPRGTAAADNWIVSETTSPLDYSPIAIATATATSSGKPEGAALQLSIQCRAGRTDLVIGSAALTRRGEDYLLSYSIGDGPSVAVATGMPAAGTGVAVKGDVVRLLASLPGGGELAVRIADRPGVVALEARYALAALKSVMERLAGPCRWSAAAGAPRAR